MGDEMGLLDQVLAEGVLGLLGHGSERGLTGLVQAFQAKGLGDIVASWVSTGPNLPISPGELREGLGDQSIRLLAQRAGLSPDAVSAKLAEILPAVIDKLTPDGRIPDAAVRGHVAGWLPTGRA